jgi:hypothetical protein
MRPIWAARACSPVPSSLPGRVATNITASYAFPGRVKSNPLCAQAVSGTGWQVSGRLACTGQAPVADFVHRPRRPPAQALDDASDDCRI